MNLKRIFLLLPLLAATTILTACGDDDKDETRDAWVGKDDKVGTKTGLFTTTAFGSLYATDEVWADLTVSPDGKTLSIVLDEVTGSPARGDIPAQMMQGFTIDGISAPEKLAGVYQFADDHANGGGTMRGAYSAFARCSVSGTITKDRLTFTVEFKFTDSDREPLMTSTYEGTYRLLYTKVLY